MNHLQNKIQIKASLDYHFTSINKHNSNSNSNPCWKFALKRAYSVIWGGGRASRLERWLCN